MNLLAKIRNVFSIRESLDELRHQMRVTDDLAKACELIVAVKHCMMFHQIHADFAVKEVLDKYGAESIHLLAKRAQDKAEEALAAWNKGK